MGSDIYDDICEFLSQNWFTKKQELTLDSSLLKLGMDGDDAKEFMEAFSEKFKVDMTNFDFNKHFSQEGSFNPIYYIYCLFFNRKRLNSIPITVRDLTIAAKNNKWTDRVT